MRSHAVRTRTDGASLSLCLSHLLGTLQDLRGNHVRVVITIVTALAAASEESALRSVQLLWINLIMDTFATLVFVTDQATEALLDR
jgi:Cation transporting ATPase, C-terminus